MTPLHVLFVAWGFPPSAEIAGRRALRNANGLHAAGFHVTVLSVEERFYPVIDPGLPRLHPFDVVRTQTLDPAAWGRSRFGQRIDSHAPVTSTPTDPGGRRMKRWLVTAARSFSAAVHPLFVPDPEIGWAIPAIRAARAIHARQPVDVVFVTTPPWSSLLPAARIARETGARLAIDYRDGWAVDREILYRRTPAQWLMDRVERRIVPRASLLLFATEGIKQFYEQYFPLVPRCEVLYNGIDAYVPPSGPIPPEPLTWVHAGSLYQGRSLEGLVRAMARVAHEMPMRLVLIGGEPTRELMLAESLGVRDRLEWLGRLSREATMQRLRVAHRLVAVISDSHPFYIPGKLFEYMSTQRPILLLAAQQHPAAKLIESIPSHRTIEISDVRGIAELAREDREGLAREGLPDVDRSATAPFEARRQTENLVRWISELGQ